ncbi:MAG TPA: cupin domain-containing protein [Thermomicrobiales bacterium]|nr:cupin domain-containing protein [Thermomicrobiales bacterium]
MASGESQPGGLPHGKVTSDVAPQFEPAFYQLDQVPAVPLAEGVAARFVTGGRIMFSFVHLDAGGEVPLHDHPHEQVGYVLDGSIVMTIGGEERHLHPGDAYTIPGGVAHRGVGGPEGCLVLDAFAPPREDYLARAREFVGRGV